MTAFRCDMCERVKAPDPGKPHLAGYREHDGDKICFDCCAVMDRNAMDDCARALDRGGRPRPVWLYLTGGAAAPAVTNWPGTLSIPVKAYKESWHNMAGRNGRRDVWFYFGRREWHGVSVGDNQCCRCLPLKRKAARVRR